MPGDVWKTGVNARVKGRGCRYCAGKVKFGKEYKSFAEALPEIIIEWHPTKNGDLTPDKVSEGSGAIVWWKCSKDLDHQWQEEFNIENHCLVLAGVLSVGVELLVLKIHLVGFTNH